VGAVRSFATLTARLAIGTVVAIGLGLTSSTASAKEIKLCLVISKTGDLADSAKEVEAGFMIGLDFATKGTMKIGDDKISVVVKDDQLKPELGRALLAECYENDKADIAVGPAGQIAAATMPIAEQRQKILISLNGRELRDNSNRYVFHLGLSRIQELVAEIATIPSGEDVTIGLLTEGTPPCRSSPSAFAVILAKLRPMAKIVDQECFLPTTTDITPSVERLFSTLKTSSGRRFVMFRTMEPEHVQQLIKLWPKGFDLTLMPRALVLPDFDELKSAVGAQGSIFYFHEFPKNPANEMLKSAYRRYSKGLLPDFFVVHGFAAASAAITALTKAGTNDTEKLIAAMEGMSFDTPKGAMIFRKDDHQVLQDMYHWRMARGGKVELVATIAARDIPLPVAPPR
jgi:branched-chain amino acid transport system substrate-binding protein